MDSLDRTVEVSRDLVAMTYTRKIDCSNYWDSHGKAIPCAATQYKFDSLKKVELYRVVREHHSQYIPTYTTEWLYLYVDGKQLEGLGEITKYRALKTKVKLDCCVGAG